MSWHPESHPLRQMQFKEGGLTRWSIPKLGYDAVRPPRRIAIKSEEHMAVNIETSRYISFPESLLRYVFIQFTFRTL